ncbi:RNA polymerase sigma factor [Paenibacillaceae bacterium WGS1546]|uniref:RNA polymerase sigma factor n=1 Tax=Cohnella sp. WGS1546 TaxID=3366810 RepID=UPI00372D56FA
MHSDEELIGEVRLGNQSALEVLIKRYYRMVFAYTFRYVGDYHAAYDLTQETLLKLVRAIHTLQQGESFKSWLLRIALNTCRDYLRSRSYKTGQQSAEYREELSGTSEQIVQLADRQADRAEITDAMMELPTYQREAVLLRFYHDMKIKDIARLTAVSEPTVKSRLKQGLAKLRKRLERSETRAKKQDRR